MVAPSPQRRVLQCLAAGALLTAAVRLGLLGAAGVAMALWRHDTERYPAAIARCVGAVVAAFFAAFLWRRAAARWRDALLVLAPLAVAFGLLLQSVRPSPYRPEAFHGVYPNGRGATWVEASPRRPRVTYRTNRWGFRGPDFDERPAAGVIRVAVVGDSFVFGSGVEEADALPAALTRALEAAAPGRRFEVLNLGIEGNNLHSHRRMLGVARRALGARVAVLGLTLPNDLVPWDIQDTVREGARLSPMTVAYAFFGERTGYFVCESWKLGSPLEGLDLGRLAGELRDVDSIAVPGSFDVLTFSFQSGGEGLRRVLQTPRVARPAVTPEGRDEFYLPMDGHPSPAGHRVFAGVIAPAVLEALREGPR